MNAVNFFVKWILATALFLSWVETRADGGGALLDYKLDYKTIKKEALLIGWEEFGYPSAEETNYYRMGTFSGRFGTEIQPSEDEFGNWHFVFGQFYAKSSDSVIRAAPDDSATGWSVVQQAVIVYTDYESYVDSTEAGVLAQALTDPGGTEELTDNPWYDWFNVNGAQGTIGQVNTGGWVYYENKVAYGDFMLQFSDPDSESDAEARAEEVKIYPNPLLPPSLQDISMIGASFREARTARNYLRYSSEFNLKLKLCEGEYVLKWRVTGKHKDDTGAPEHFPQERSITIDENTQLDADGYYDLGWIDIAQGLTPDYIYRLANYKDDSTQKFYLEPKDECGCADVGSGGVGFGSVKAWFNLGKDASGKSAGFIKLHAENITSTTHLPAALKVVNGDSNSTRFVYDDNGVLKQAQSDRRIIDIVPLAAPAEGYELKFYKAEDATGWVGGRFRGFAASGSMPAATPELTWTVKRLADASGYKRLEITRSEGGSDFVHVFGQGITTATDWSFSEAGGLRTTTRTESSAPGGDLYRTTTLSDTAYGTASVKRERVHTFAWGEDVVEETLDPAGTNSLTTTYEYYTSGVGQGQLWKTTGPAGVVTENTYVSTSALGVTGSMISSTQTTYPNGRVETTTHGTLADLTSNSADAVNSLVTSTETFGGQVIRRSWQIGYATAVTIGGVDYQESRSIRAAATTAAWDDSRNEVTITRVADTSTGRVNLTLTSDGKISRVHHGLPDSEGIRAITTESGPSNANGTGLLTGAGGTRTEQEVDASGRTVQTTTTDIASGLVTALELVTEWSTTNPDLATNISYLDGSEEVRNYSTCCGKLESVTRHGQTTSYTYDDLGRQETETSNGLTTKMRYDAEGRVRETTVYPEGSPLLAKLVSGETYDPAGRLTASVAPHGIGQTVTTTRSEVVNATTGETTSVTTYPSDTNLIAGVVTEVRAADGLSIKRTGNASAPVSFSYSAGSLPDASSWGYGSGDRFFVTVETKLDANGDPTSETHTTYQDALGRTIKVSYVGGAVARNFYDAAGRLSKAVDPDGVTSLHAYATGSFGEKRTVAIDLAATIGGSLNGTIDYAGGHDRVTETTTLIAQRGSVTVRRTKVDIWENGTASTEANVTDTSLDGLKSWSTTVGAQTTETTVIIGSGGIKTETTLFPDGTESIRVFVGGRLTDISRKDSEGIVISAVSQEYDDYGRLESSTQAGVGTTGYTYYDDGQVHTVTTPDPDATRSGAGYDPQTTTYTYNTRGWVSKITHPDATETETTYYPAGKVKRTWGGRTYPVEYAYDAQGRMKTLTTWQDFAGTSGAAITTWNYNPQRGWLDSKHYDDDKGPSYTYTDAGRLETRTWQRGVVTTYGYTDAGDLHTVTYSDSTPSVTHTYSRDGKLHTTTDAAGLLTRTYTGTGKLDGEVYSGGLLNTLSLGRGYDSLDRLESLTTTGATVINYGYDDASRLETITQGTRVATIGYKPNVGTVQTVTTAVSATERVKHERTTDNLGRVGRVDTTGNGATLHARRDYTYNSANQRTRVEHEDSRRWAYGYDALGQVAMAEKRLSDDTTVLPGYAFGYQFDDIGNRKSTMTNGRSATYHTNLLNQYDERVVPSAVDVRGSASTGVTVLVNDALTTRTGEDFFKAVPVANGSVPVNAAIKIQAVDVGPPEQVATENRTAFVQKTTEVFDYDDDGNLMADGRWAYIWDGENRLTTIETLSSVASTLPALKQRLDFAYDSQGRRISKTVKTWDAGTSTWTVQTEVRFLYDGWNLAGEYLASDYTPVQLPVWGLDVSGSMQGAGGVGGLLWVTKSTGTHVPGYDANGNVIAWIDSTSGSVVGGAEYGAFGEPVRVSGAAATQSYGFSTKYLDKETGLNYYGFRYYNPSTGRWLSRDPIAEHGGLNLYAFHGNNLVGGIDYLGLWLRTVCSDAEKTKILNAAKDLALSNYKAAYTNYSKWSLSAAKAAYPNAFKNKPGVSDPEKQYNKLSERLFRGIQRVRDKISSNSVIADACNDPAKKCKSGNVNAYTTFTGNTIWFCPQFFDQSAEDRANTVAHEISHIAIKSGDFVGGDVNDWSSMARDAYFYGDIGGNGLDATLGDFLNDMAAFPGFIL
jgi:RHS repeat-associated protein